MNYKFAEQISTLSYLAPAKLLPDPTQNSYLLKSWRSSFRNIKLINKVLWVICRNLLKIIWKTRCFIMLINYFGFNTCHKEKLLIGLYVRSKYLYLRSSKMDWKFLWIVYCTFNHKIGILININKRILLKDASGGHGNMLRACLLNRLLCSN